ncbi:hypothetical protein AGMMS49928_00470 [Spirochaetia bacterium]|nr:hypothetical protein AGMMS49928_00470 [Spirochaetia bacterium]
MLLFIIIPLSVILLGVIAWLAISENSSRAVRRVALFALTAIVLSVILSIIVIFLFFGEPAAVVGPGIGDEIIQPVKPVNDRSFSIIIFMVLLLAFLALILFLALRREKKTIGQMTKKE